MVWVGCLFGCLIGCLVAWLLFDAPTKIGPKHAKQKHRDRRRETEREREREREIERERERENKGFAEAPCTFCRFGPFDVLLPFVLFFNHFDEKLET